MEDKLFIKGLHRIWWVPLFTGILSLCFGIWCFCAPLSSLTFFAYLFSAGLFLAGCLNIGYAIANAKLATNWGWSLVLGILEIAVAIWLFCTPAPTLANAFAWAAGIWVIIAAINGIGEAVYFSRNSAGWTVVMVILLALSVFFGFFFLFNPVLSGFMGWCWIGCSLITFGIWRIALACKIRSFNKKFHD
ncbi:MAG: DUF308 domain-containing protein [Clostridium sp.]|nr:DUF308 domain-containing protein [Prevotella sp.]MCM1429730.1 DUF308 domain-containing protein [Clostridium sp.]MCM1476203.1 DUF308 domain-containing protein [Muribaculaceae bacterium]